MPGSWIVTRVTKEGGKRYLVRYRLGGRESAQRYAGSFRTRAEALERRRWLDGELAAMRVPDLSRLDSQPVRAPTLADAVAAYRASRIDIAEATRVNIGTSLNLIAGALEAGHPVDAFAPQEIADAVARLHASGYKRETIRKAVTHLACVFDFAEIEPNPGRDKLRVRLPRARFESPSRRVPITLRPCIGSCRRSIGSPCSGSTGRAPASRASTRPRSATTTSRAVASACAPPSPRPGAASGSTSRACSPKRSSGRYRRARIATRKPGCLQRAAPTRSGRASRRHVAPPACLSGRRTTSAIGGSASCTDKGARGRRSERSLDSAR